MATCKKMTVAELLAAAKKAAGRALTADERVSIEQTPPSYVCTGAGVAGTSKRKRKPKSG